MEIKNASKKTLENNPEMNRVINICKCDEPCSGNTERSRGYTIEELRDILKETYNELSNELNKNNPDYLSLRGAYLIFSERLGRKIGV